MNCVAGKETVTRSGTTQGPCYTRRPSQVGLLYKWLSDTAVQSVRLVAERQLSFYLLMINMYSPVP